MYSDQRPDLWLHKELRVYQKCGEGDGARSASGLTVEGYLGLTCDGNYQDVMPGKLRPQPVSNRGKKEAAVQHRHDDGRC